MNHRYGNRLAVHIDVFIHQKGQQMGPYQTRDISPYGVFLETGDLDVDLGSSVDLTFLLSDKPDDKRKIKGMVIRRSYDGAAFMLAAHYRQIFPRLKLQDVKTPLAGQRGQHEQGRRNNKFDKGNSPLVSRRFVD